MLIVAIFVILIVVAGVLIYYQDTPATSKSEGFASGLGTGTGDSKALLDQLASCPNTDSTDADELRLLIKKITSMEADITSPIPGSYRSFGLQFRTQQDIEPPATIVGRCLAGAVSSRDNELIVEKFKQRGQELIQRLALGPSASGHFNAIVAELDSALKSKCKSPTMDHPSGARDVGFWEPDSISELSQYQGVSAAPKEK